jgi:hypothetical protein
VGILTVGWRIGHHLGVVVLKKAQKPEPLLERFIKEEFKTKGISLYGVC